MVVCLAMLVYSGTGFAPCPDEYETGFFFTMSHAPVSTSSSIDITDHVSVAASTARISCDGGGGALGHPQIWLTLQKPEEGGPAKVVCPYCSRLFVGDAA